MECHFLLQGLTLGELSNTQAGEQGSFDELFWGYGGITTQVWGQSFQPIEVRGFTDPTIWMQQAAFPLNPSHLKKSSDVFGLLRPTHPSVPPMT